MGKLRDRLRPYYSGFRPIYVPILQIISLAFDPERRQRLVADQIALREINQRLAADQTALREINQRLVAANAISKESETFAGKAETADAEDSAARPGRRATEMATGMMNRTDIEAVIALARMVPRGGIVVDVGSLLGMTASLWCIHSKASRIICIDLWRYGSWLESFAQANGDISKDAFLRNVPDDRIEAIQGSSPSCVSEWWTTPVDLFWDDADHGYPAFANNLQFWSQHVRSGGIMCGHDFHLPEVNVAANALADNWGSALNIHGSVWWFRKPNDETDRQSPRAA